MAVKVKINTTDAHYQLAVRGSQHAIAIGSNNVIWAVYFEFIDLLTRHMAVAHSLDGGATWTEEIIPNTEDVYGWDGLSIMVSSDNVPHVIYYQETVGVNEIRYISRLGGVWGMPETVHVQDFVVEVKAVIDSADTIHIVFERTDINYISGVSGAWNISEVVDALAGFQFDVAIDNSNRPVVAFHDGVKIYVRYKDGVWQPRDPVSNINVHPGLVIAVDSAGDYHVAWSGEESLAPWDYEVYYRKKEGGVWLATQVLDGNNFDNWFIGGGIDDEDNAYVVYQPDTGAPDEAVYYRKITNGTILGPEITIDAGILRPNTNSSVFAFLYHKHPARGILPAALQPVVVLLDEVPVGFPYADLYFYAEDFLVIAPAGGANQGILELLA